MKHADDVRHRRPAILARGIGIAVIGLVCVFVGGTWGFLGAALVFLAVTSTLAALVALPDGVRAWRTGAVGEEMTAAALTALPPGFVVLHDRRKPGSRANIDHIVLGPTGVWVVETKNYGGSLAVRGGDLWIAGRRKTSFIGQVKGEAAAVSQALGDVPAIPILCVHRAEFPLLGRQELGGVRIVGPRGLVGAIETAPVVLEPAEAARLAALAEQRLPPALR